MKEQNNPYTNMGHFLMTGIADGTGHQFEIKPALVSVSIPKRTVKPVVQIDMNEVAFQYGLIERRIADLAEVTANSKGAA